MPPSVCPRCGQSIPAPPPAPDFRFRHLLKRVCAMLDVNQADVLGPRRYKRLVDARAIIAAALRERGWALTDIGRAMNRDHTTIISLLKRGWDSPQLTTDSQQTIYTPQTSLKLEVR